MLLTRALAFSANQFFMQEKVPTSTYVHSVRIEPTKLILECTRITYKATGHAGRSACRDNTKEHTSNIPWVPDICIRVLRYDV